MEIYRPEKNICELIQIYDLWNHVNYGLVFIHSCCFYICLIVIVSDIWPVQKTFHVKVKILTPSSWENRE